MLSMRRVQVYRHSLEPGAQPECIFEEKDEKYYVTISKTADKQLILIHAAASMQNEIRFLRSDTPGGDFQVWPAEPAQHVPAPAATDAGHPTALAPCSASRQLSIHRRARLQPGRGHCRDRMLASRLPQSVTAGT